MTEKEPRECPIQVTREEFIMAIEARYQQLAQDYLFAKLGIEDLNGLLETSNRAVGEGLKVKYFLDRTSGVPSLEMEKKKRIGFIRLE